MDNIPCYSMRFDCSSGCCICQIHRCLFPWISEQMYLFQAGSLKINTTMVVAIAMIIFLTWLNTRGIVTGKTVQNIFSSTKVIALVRIYCCRIPCNKRHQFFEINREVFWKASQVRCWQSEVYSYGWICSCSCNWNCTCRFAFCF